MGPTKLHLLWHNSATDHHFHLLRLLTELLQSWTQLGSNVGDENDVGDKVGRDQSWHKWPSAPRALFCQPTRFSATLHGTVHFGDVWCALLNNLWCGVIWCIIVHFGEVFVWFCMVWCNSMEWYGTVWCKWNGFIQYGANPLRLPPSLSCL